jgi:riboflavin synthase
MISTVFLYQRVIDMFTGIVQDKAQITSISHGETLTKYSIKLPSARLDGLQIGASLSVNGICQTVRAIEKDIVSFDAIQETRACTTISSWKCDDWVNVERSLKMGDEIGGHILSGHIVTVGTVNQIEHPSEEQAIFTIHCDPQWIKYIFHKGYIALNGVSLTVGEVDTKNSLFTVNLIPESRRITTFGNAFVGEKINIEIDSQTQTIVDTVARLRFPLR